MRESSLSAHEPKTEDAKMLRKKLVLAEAATRAARTKKHQLERVSNSTISWSSTVKTQGLF